MVGVGVGAAAGFGFAVVFAAAAAAGVLSRMSCRLPQVQSWAMPCRFAQRAAAVTAAWWGGGVRLGAALGDQRDHALEEREGGLPQPGPVRCAVAVAVQQVVPEHQLEHAAVRQRVPHVLPSDRPQVVAR